MKLRSLALFIFVHIFILQACQSNLTQTTNMNNKTVVSEEITKAYDVVGTVVEVDKTNDQLLLNLEKQSMIKEDQVWIEISDTTVMKNEEEYQTVDDFVGGEMVMVNVEDLCLDMGIRVCFAEEVGVYELKKLYII